MRESILLFLSCVLFVLHNSGLNPCLKLTLDLVLPSDWSKQLIVPRDSIKKDSNAFNRFPLIQSKGAISTGNTTCLLSAGMVESSCCRTSRRVDKGTKRKILELQTINRQIANDIHSISAKSKHRGPGEARPHSGQLNAGEAMRSSQLTIRTSTLSGRRRAIANLS